MPLKVRRVLASFLLVLFAIVSIYSQTEATPSAADVMRERIAKAKAHLAVRNYNAAIFEMESIRQETSDPTLHSVLNVLLMHSYLEQTDYKRAQEFLNEFYKELKADKPNAMANYYAVAAQIVKGARNQLDRYRGLGLSVTDRNLPLEALMDVEKMRETLEVLVGQTKELGADKRHGVNALPLLEEATSARITLAKDDYDANRWKQEITDAREMLVTSRSTIINAVDPVVAPAVVAQNANGTAGTAPSEIVPTFQAVTTEAKETAPARITTPKAIVKTDVAAAEAPNKEELQPAEKPAEESAKAAPKTAVTDLPRRERIIVGGGQPTETPDETTKTETAAGTETAPTETATDSSPLAVGSLLEHATRRVNPIYPPAAKMSRMTGIVRVEVTVGEDGKVDSIENTVGPAMLQQAAIDALRKWQFKPFTRDGQPVKATGFVSFNFNL